MSVQIKICGVTQPEQAQAIAALGADYIGCIAGFAASPRSLDDTRVVALAAVLQNSSTQLVGVTVNRPAGDVLALVQKTGIGIVQLHGDEDMAYVNTLQTAGVQVWKTVSDEAAAVTFQSADALVVDDAHPEHGRGGSGRVSDWQLAARLVAAGNRVVLSGGLGVDNVSEAIAAVQPAVVDASSRLETSPGVKDMALVEQFITTLQNNS